MFHLAQQHYALPYSIQSSYMLCLCSLLGMAVYTLNHAGASIFLFSYMKMISHILPYRNSKMRGMGDMREATWSYTPSLLPHFVFFSDVYKQVWGWGEISEHFLTIWQTCIRLIFVSSLQVPFLDANLCQVEAFQHLLPRTACSQKMVLGTTSKSVTREEA